MVLRNDEDERLHVRIKPIEWIDFKAHYAQKH